MPCLLDLSNGFLVDVLDLSCDGSVLELAAASKAMQSAVEACRWIAPVCSRFPWRHLQGKLKLNGLWRYWGLGDLKRNPIPFATLCCEIEFQNLAEVMAFLRAANHLAADTVDGQVTFVNKFAFEAGDVAHLYFGEDDGNGRWCSAGQTKVFFNGRPVECSIEAHRDEEEEVPWINVSVDHDLPMNPMISCSSLHLPELRMEASLGSVYDVHDLQAESPLTELVRASKPLPMFLGVTGFDAA
ncbi:aglC [Symbiodinium natans]|uniref:AglC protein n=1 Tax=Symbiodinium natans TaxID=878477 RepID=A0A812M754_9DINO|nr:aglC [Symbiodinium natans]